MNDDDKDGYASFFGLLGVVLAICLLLISSLRVASALERIATALEARP